MRMLNSNITVFFTSGQTIATAEIVTKIAPLLRQNLTEVKRNIVQHHPTFSNVGRNIDS